VNAWYWVGAISSALIFLYLLYALLRAEEF
jgi:K+-transporting ATPase KdpF subunit